MYSGLCACSSHVSTFTFDMGAATRLPIPSRLAYDANVGSRFFNSGRSVANHRLAHLDSITVFSHNLAFKVANRVWKVAHSPKATSYLNCLHHLSSPIHLCNTEEP
jgi:hypothetical protein